MDTFNIKNDNLYQLSRFEHRPPEPSYLAGFIDGDGCIFIRKIKDGYQSGISINQCRTNILQVVRYHFGGSITSSTKRNSAKETIVDETHDLLDKNNRRNQYNLIIRSNEYQRILEYLNDTLVIKWEQMKCVQEFKSFINKPKYKKERDQCFINYKSISVIKHYNFENVNIEYIAGLCDAEGCFFVHKTKSCHYIKISQLSHISVLHKICELLGYGQVIDHEYKITNSQDCLNFITIIKNHLIVKYNQCNYFENYLLNKTNKETTILLLNIEKHSIEKYTELNVNNTGIEKFTEYNQLKKQQKELNKEFKRVYRKMRKNK